jgi:hypothetical protein
MRASENYQICLCARQAGRLQEIVDQPQSLRCALQVSLSSIHSQEAENPGSGIVVWCVVSVCCFHLFSVYAVRPVVNEAYGSNQI